MLRSQAVDAGKKTRNSLSELLWWRDEAHDKHRLIFDVKEIGGMHEYILLAQGA